MPDIETLEAEYMPDDLWHLPDGTTYEDLAVLCEEGNWYIREAWQREDSPNLVVILWRTIGKTEKDIEEQDE